MSDKYYNYALKVQSELRKAKVRTRIDSRSEKIGAKIRDAELKKIPIMLIVGEREEASNTASVRRRFQGDLGSIEVNTLVANLNDEIINRKRGDTHSK